MATCLSAIQDLLGHGVLHEDETPPTKTPRTPPDTSEASTADAFPLGQIACPGLRSQPPSAKSGLQHPALAADTPAMRPRLTPALCATIATIALVLASLVLFAALRSSPERARRARHRSPRRRARSRSSGRGRPWTTSTCPAPSPRRSTAPSPRRSSPTAPWSRAPTAASSSPPSSRPPPAGSPPSTATASSRPRACRPRAGCRASRHPETARPSASRAARCRRPAPSASACAPAASCCWPPRRCGGAPKPMWLMLLTQLVLPLLLMGGLGIAIVFFIRQQRRGGGSRGGAGKIRKDVVVLETGVRFTDVAGCDEAVEELEEIVEFLQEPGALRTRRRPHAARRDPARAARHRQDAAREGRGRREPGALLRGQRLGLRRGLRRPGRRPRARPVRPGLPLRGRRGHLLRRDRRRRPRPLRLARAPTTSASRR